MAPAAGPLQGAIAATRFGLGARPDVIEADRAKLDTLVYPDSAALRPVEGLKARQAVPNPRLAARLAV